MARPPRTSPRTSPAHATVNFTCCAQSAGGTGHSGHAPTAPASVLLWIRSRRRGFRWPMWLTRNRSQGEPTQTRLSGQRKRGLRIGLVFFFVFRFHSVVIAEQLFIFNRRIAVHVSSGVAGRHCPYTTLSEYPESFIPCKPCLRSLCLGARSRWRWPSPPCSWKPADRAKCRLLQRPFR